MLFPNEINPTGLNQNNYQIKQDKLLFLTLINKLVWGWFLWKNQINIR
jgi:hypothetical protein